MSELENLSEKARENPSEVEMAAILDAFDVLIDRLEEHAASYEAELPVARETGNHAYITRVERGARETSALVEFLEEEVLDRLGRLRFTAGQMRAAREQRLV